MELIRYPGLILLGNGYLKTKYEQDDPFIHRFHTGAVKCTRHQIRRRPELGIGKSKGKE